MPEATPRAVPAAVPPTVPPAAPPAAPSATPATQVDPELLPLPEVAEKLGIAITAVHQLLKDGRLVATADSDGRRAVPRLLVAAGSVPKGLPAVITLLRDARFSDADIVAWLYRTDDALPGTPAEALAANRGTEIKRRAQAAGF